MNTITNSATNTAVEIPVQQSNSEKNQTVGNPFVDSPRMTARGVDVFYGEKQAIFGVDLDIGKNEVLAMIGPSGCGKSTFLRTLNRMNDTIDICKIQGDICLDGKNIYYKIDDFMPTVKSSK